MCRVEPYLNTFLIARQRPVRLPSRPPATPAPTAVTPSEKLQAIRGHSFKSCSCKSSRSSQRAASRHPSGTRGPSVAALEQPHPGLCSGLPVHEVGALFPLCIVRTICSEQEPTAPSLERNPEGVGPLSGSEPLHVTSSLRSPTHTELCHFSELHWGVLGGLQFRSRDEVPLLGTELAVGTEGGRRAQPVPARPAAAPAETRGHRHFPSHLMLAVAQLPGCPR